MAQDRMAESAATVKTLYGTENPCYVKGSPELGDIMQKFIYSDVNNQVQMPLAQKELLTIVVLTANATPEEKRFTRPRLTLVLPAPKTR